MRNESRRAFFEKERSIFDKAKVALEHCPPGEVNRLKMKKHNDSLRGRYSF
jgi:hypothetical protein